MIKQIDIILRMQTFITALTCLILISSSAWAAKVFVDPDTTYVTGGPGSVFSFDIEVDAATTNLFAYHIMVKYDKTLLDSVAVTEGPLLASGGGSTIFFGGVDSDSSHVEGTSAILGGGGVNGPGVLFTVTVKVSGSGIYNIDLDTVILRDTANTTIPSTSANGIAYINVPPSIFNLLTPADAAVINHCLGESLLFDWQTSTSPYPGNVVRYTLEYSTSPTFIPAQTTKVDSLIPSQHKVLVNSFTHNSIIYWRVTAFDQFGFTRQSNPFSSREFVIFLSKAPTPFNLLSPDDDSVILSGLTDTLVLDWENSFSPCGTPITYKLFISRIANFQPESTVTFSGLIQSQFKLPIDTFSQTGTIIRYWKATAEDTFGLATNSSQQDWNFSIQKCLAIPGDANSSGGNPNLSDIIYLVNNVFKGGPDPNPLCRGDVNGSGGFPNLSDIIYLVNHVFKGGVAPVKSGVCCL